MKNITLILLPTLLLFYSCKKHDKEENKQIQQSIYRATCKGEYSTGESLTDKSKAWSLSKNDIDKILSLSVSITENEWHFAYPVTPCNIDVKDYFYKGKKYNLQINGGSYLSLYDGTTTTLLGCDAPECLKYFLKSPANNEEESTTVESSKTLNPDKRCSLPLDFETYYRICMENGKECQSRYPSYTYPENKNILDFYSITEAPSRFFLLPKINNLQPVVLAYTDTDVEGYHLIIAEKGKMISSLQIAEFDGETVQDFIISKDFDIELYSRNNTTEKRMLKKKYKVQKNGFILEISY